MVKVIKKKKKFIDIRKIDIDVWKIKYSDIQRDVQIGLLDIVKYGVG